MKRKNDNWKLVQNWNKNKDKIIKECFNGDDKEIFKKYIEWLGKN